ncbi:MAG: CDP-glycerol glycerophosphotransferase family protein [Clostridia bacterium]|nr:CDP-glycerol glycerophosphotransferase family protein [Clostridia bacterium]
MKKLIKNIIKNTLILYKKLTSKLKIKKSILFCSQSTTMDEHLLKVYNCIKDENFNIKFVFFNKSKIDKVKYQKYNLNKKLIIKSKVKFFLCNPDLIITADLMYLSKYFISKILYINHGSSTICFEGHKDIAFSYHNVLLNGEKPYDLYFETNKKACEHMQSLKEYENKIVFSGNKFSDELNSEMKNYEKYRTQLGIKPNQKTIFIAASWKESSLFHKLGKSIFEEIKNLSKNEDLKFILSIHPNEYHVYDENIEPLGKYVDEMEQFGCIIKKPGTDFIPYMIASDLVICDFSSVGDNAIMAEKNLVYSEFSRDDLYEFSSANVLYDKLPKLKNSKDLEKIISSKYPKEAKAEILNFKELMTSPKGSYKQLCIKHIKSLLTKKEKN